MCENQGLPTWIEERDHQLVIRLYVQPGAKSNSVVGMHNGSLKIRIAAPAVEGAANAALLDFLAKSLGIRKSVLSLMSGQQSRIKKVSLPGERALKEKLLAWNHTLK